MAQTVKSLPPVQETRVQSLDQEESLEEGMATHSSILAYRIPWTEKPGGPWGRKALDMTNTFTFIVVYNVMPISVVQQSDSVIHIRHSFFFFFFGCNLCHGGGGGS